MIKRQQKTETMDFRTFIYPLNDFVWACMLGTSVLIIISKILSTKIKINPLEIAWATFATYFGGHFSHQESYQNAYKITIFISLFCGNVIWMGYQASLTVDLSSPSHKLPFNSLETFLKSGWSLHTHRKG